MSTNCNTIVSVLSKNGTDQKQRYIAALQPNNIQLLDFDVSDWILFAYNFASHVNYFETNNPSQSIDDWTSFFNSFQLDDKNPSFTKSFELQRIKESLKTLLEDYKKEGALTPHLTLFVTFLLLLEQSKKRFNALTKRHLDFYYKDILQIEKLPAKPDKVYLLFELAKNASQQKIDEGTSFDGGKDANGKIRIYKSTDELIANKTTVSLLKNIYHDKENKKIVISPIANSLDGIGGQFPAENNQYWPFGHTDISFPELPSATLGFAIAAPILVLKEGKRSIEFVFTFKNNITNTTINQVINNTTIYLTTQKGWFQVPTILSTVAVKTGTSFVTSVQNKILKIAFQLDENVDAITNYDAKIFGEGFNDALPLAKFIINTATTEGYELYRSLASNILKEITINVDVQNIKNVILENDNSTINALKPFFPFTTIPLAGSNFYVKYEEALGKQWKNIDFSITWKNTPTSFSEHYKGYKQNSIPSISTNDYVLNLLDNTNKFKTEGAIVTSDAYFKYDLDILSNNIWTELANKADQTLFTKNGSVFKTDVSLSNSNYQTAKNGKIRLVSKQSFLHNLYPKFYALALASRNANVVIPNEPYTPLAENVTFNYSASETSFFEKQVSQSLEETYLKNDAFLYHIHPFGYSEEHPYLKSSLDFVSDKNISLLPIYCAGGELFIGLENTKALEQVTLLFQVLEGSENPLTPSFTRNQKIEWSILGNNEWKKLDYTEILLNETDNLLRSGILKFNLPKEATQDNTVLPKNYVWLKGKMHKKFDAVCKLIGIHAQVVLAVFENNSNELAHLETGLEAESISKLTQRVSMVKSIQQPYNSFDYRTEESNEDYYRRVSERLRHKNRAITMWDYEHIILQEFPELYKVKCLNHTSENSFQAPGNVTLVVVPDTVNKNVFDIYQPRVSTATLNKVQNHIAQLNTMHTNTFVINPNYEVVTVSLAVKFKTGFDVNFYTKELGKDITKFLSPWAYDKTIPITFGVSVHISVLIDYLEKLGYVDYLENVRLIKNGGSPQKMVTPSNPKSILVSAKEEEHLISTNIKGCKTITIEENETCQL
ncbi:Phage baseplate protein [Flavobacterium sp. 9AF]|uniref:baseplate J/gp47 family protein n=1 Tax=Flavobacterium sp. 9AF TaxID=2653142 RepID=UPI0012F454AF|nr:baseplate J/gp47 family protein [Flavobacterium sp. 9AF]VXB29991.1 Phage baseplate protein [Flavobacterium sp. 9AF]